MTGKQSILAGVLVCGVGLALFGLWPRGYGPVSEPAYQLATATYNACMAKSMERVGRVEALLNEAGMQQKLSKTEIKWISDMLEKARRERWQEASRLARRMMEDQIQVK